MNVKFTMTEEIPNTNNENETSALDSSSNESPAETSAPSVDSSTPAEVPAVDESPVKESDDNKESNTEKKSDDNKESNTEKKSDDKKSESKLTRSTKTETRLPPKSLSDIFIGKKPVMSYAMAAMIQLTQNGSVSVKARGMVISRAVDVAEITTKRLAKGEFETKDVKIGTEVLQNESGQHNVSTIEILLGKK